MNGGRGAWVVRIVAVAVLGSLVLAACGRGRLREPGGREPGGGSPGGGTGGTGGLFSPEQGCPPSPKTEQRQGVKAILGVQYSDPEGGPLCGDLYRPDNDDRLPVVVTFHGGGFVQGSRQDLTHLAVKIAQAGFAVFNVDYRLAPDFVYPAQRDDANAAVAFVKDRADEFNIDGSKVGTVGTSAGGTIVGGLATENPPPVTTAVSWSGAFDFTTDPTNVQSASEKQNISLLPPCDGSDQECQNQAKEVSPVFLVDSQTAPMALFNSTNERMKVSQAQEMADALQQAGVDDKLIVLDGDRHALQYLPDAIGPTIDWLKQWLV